MCTQRPNNIGQSRFGDLKKGILIFIYSAFLTLHPVRLLLVSDVNFGDFLEINSTLLNPRRND